MRKRAAVLGSPIAHSLSPAIHNAAYLALGIEGKYDAVQVKEHELSNFMAQVRETDANWIGFSLTMPLKEEVLKVADLIEPLAKKIHAGNTLIPTPDGWLAATTDVSGFIWALSANQVFDFSSVTIIGAGATARAAAAAVDASGRTITIISRNPERELLLREIVTQGEIRFIDWNSPNLDSDLVINTTPKNVADQLDPGTGIYFESLYEPWPTNLANRWNGQVISGLHLLVHQAIDQIHMMTGFVIDRRLMAPLLMAAAEAELRDRKQARD